MLKIGSSMLLAAVMLAVGVSAVRAQDTPSDQPPPKKKKDPTAGWRKLFNSFDTNKDGIITWEEYKANRMFKGKDEAVVKGSFAKMDRKGDGKVTWEEFLDTWSKRGDSKKKAGSGSSSGGSSSSKSSNQ
jgi:hypothetical protein